MACLTHVADYVVRHSGNVAAENWGTRYSAPAQLNIESSYAEGDRTTPPPSGQAFGENQLPASLRETLCVRTSGRAPTMWGLFC